MKMILYLILAVLLVGAEAASTQYQPHCMYLNPSTGFSDLASSTGRYGRSAEVKNDSSEEAPVAANIMGGTAVPHKGWPFLVAVLVKGDTLNYNGQYWDLVCGAALIHPQYILTAAHCFVDENRFRWHFLDASNFVARVGDYDLVHKRVPTARTLRIVEYKTYPGFSYDSVEGGYDIAVAKLEQPIQLNDWAQPACLPQPGSPVPRWNSPCLVAGWGSINREGTKLSSYPRITTLHTSSTSTCYSTLEIPRSAHDGRMFCAGDRNGQTDSCAGDSGGPTFCKRINGDWELSGVVSFGGETCADSAVPGAYTTVSWYINWIHQTMNSFSAPTPPAMPSNPSPRPSWPSVYYSSSSRNPWQTYVPSSRRPRTTTRSNGDEILIQLLEQLVSSLGDQIVWDESAGGIEMP